MSRLLTVCLSLAVSASTSLGFAHFPWIVLDGAEEQASVYFSESAEPDDAEHLKDLAGVKIKAWNDRSEPKEFEPQTIEAALVAEVGRAQTVYLSHRYHKVNRRGESVLMQYEAKAHAWPLSGTWTAIGSGSQLPLEIAARRLDRQVQLKVLFQGKPLAQAPIYVSGAGLDSLEGKTDNEGSFLCQPTANGLLEVRTRRMADESGEYNGQEYTSIRHWSTLTMPVHAATLKSVSHELSPLPHGITSFGAAVAGDWLYLYGGQIGGAHHYWREGQSPDFMRLNLREESAWEKLTGGPRRTGTALVAHKGLLYRVGGFEARNDEKDDSDLHSMPDVARFDPATGEWSAMPDLPLGRSSHDAAVLGDTLYVVGGWTLAGKGNSTWQTDMLSLDLADKQAAWQSIDVPFRRRALSAAAHDGKLYVIGGMQEDGNTTTTVNVYDPRTKAWSDAPPLFGAPLEGFGTSAFGWDGKLRVTTMSGAIQQLAEDGLAWQVAGQLQQRRFFHRMLPMPGNRGAIVGGADMETGKVLELEVIEAIEGKDNSKTNSAAGAAGQ
ncbi:MAG: hypothetical protein AB7O62_24085 [Pirellulales bacterium]